MQLSGRAGNFVQRIDFGYLLPIMSKLPLPLGYALSVFRGIVAAALDYEWRSQAIGFNYIRGRTFQAMRMLQPEAGYRFWRNATIQRFINNSRDEWLAGIYDRSIMEKICRKSVVEGLEPLLAVQASRRGIVMISCHYDGFMGMALLGMKGLRVNALTTAAGNEDPRIHPAVRAFLKRKYRKLEFRMNGRIVYQEEDMPFFYEALKRGETVVLFGDVPGSKSTLQIPFLNTRFRLPLGAWHFAVRTNSVISATICIHEGIGRYRVKCMPSVEVNPQDPLISLKPAYEFIERHILRSPERWVAADLLPAYKLSC
ncbi:MAG: hypothetical protein AB1547_08005 [Thermodesulfobacteriota bacterium]